MKLFLFLLLFTNPSFTWEPSHKLQWSDYQGVYDNSEANASTCTELYMDMNKDSSGGVVFNVKAIFHPESSFISPTCSKSLYALRHEQLHFDITEVYARQLRLLLHTMQHTRNQANVKMAGYFYEFVKDAWNHAEEQYDLESIHSQNEINQQKWNKKIKEMLVKSQNYADKPH